MSQNTSKNVEEKGVSKASIIGAVVGAIVGAGFGQLFLGDTVGLGPVAFLPVGIMFGVAGYMGAALLD
ncbi:MAG: hypothetical protein HYS06_00205 [Methylocystis sp.]|nr:hypothetical protein [Methylocystis sp.]